MKIRPDQVAFKKLAQSHNIVPVYLECSTDMETPVSIYYKLVGEDIGFILESADSNKSFGRYSFMGTAPFAKITAKAKGSTIKIGNETAYEEGSPLTILQSFLGRFSVPPLPGLPPLAGGAVGYFAYESIATWERVRGLQVPADMVLAELLFCKVMLIMDHLTHTTTLLYLASIGQGDDIDEVYQEAVKQLTLLAEKLKLPLQACYSSANEATSAGTVFAQMEFEQQYIEKVRQAKEYIAAGDIFQVVLSQQFRQKFHRHPFQLYRRLRQVNPSPYMFYMNFGDRKLVGASPERLVKLEDGQVFTYPIAGTRPRGRDAAHDAELAAELLADTKETAEHAMLVDLGRNDVGRISLPGTVEVKRLMEVENFSHVMHLVSEVVGSVDPKYTAADVLAACFPAGTLSGAPKVRAMEIINELEETRRGPYGGAVGYIDFRGNMDTCITIRTMVIDGDEVTVQTGAGIVADSVPEKEYQEVLHKARALFKVLAEDNGHDTNH